jgi:hypothetical protein
MLQTVVRTPWLRDQPVARQLPRQNNTNTEKRRHTSVFRVGFEPTILVFEWAKTLRVIDRMTTAAIDGNKADVLRKYNYIRSAID